MVMMEFAITIYISHIIQVLGIEYLSFPKYN